MRAPERRRADDPHAASSDGRLRSLETARQIVRRVELRIQSAHQQVLRSSITLCRLRLRLARYNDPFTSGDSEPLAYDINDSRF